MKIFRVLYIFFLSCLISKALCAQDQVNVNLLNSTLGDVYKVLTPFSSVSYNLDIIVKLDNSVLNSYKADVFEVFDQDSHLTLYKLGDKDVLVTYSDISGIERFWFGRFENLPEVLSNQVDQTVLDSSITYSSLLINPSWLNLPFNLKEDQGFKVIQTYNKNLYSSFSKTEFYFNKDNIPIRMLYYNNISNFPLLEALVTDYKKINNGFFITKITYKSSSNNKITFLEKTNININPKIPSSFFEVQKLIKNNINNFHSSFAIGIRSSIDVNSLPNIPIVTKESKSSSLEDSNNLYDTNQKGSSASSNNLPDNNVDSKNKTSNNTLLKALQGLNNIPSSDSLKNNNGTNKNTKKILNKKKLAQSMDKKHDLKKVDIKNNKISKQNKLSNNATTKGSKNTNNTSTKNKTNTHLEYGSNSTASDSLNKLNNNVSPEVKKPSIPEVQKTKPNSSSDEDLNSLF